MPELRSNEKKYRVPFFRLFMIFYAVIFAFSLIYGITLLNDFLEVYERSRPVHAIESYMSGVTDGFYREAVESSVSVSPTEFERAEDIRSVVENGLETAHTYSYKKKADEYSDERPVYLIMADGSVFLKLTFEAEKERDKFDFPIWSVASEETLVDFAFEPAYSVRAMVPDYASLYINGVEVGDEFITDSGKSVPELEAISDFIEVMPHYKEYTVTGLYCEPNVFAQENDGALEGTIADGEYRFEFEKSDALKSEHSEYVIEMEKAYISFMINENREGYDNFPRLGKYILSEAPIYRQISGCSVSSNNPFESREDKLLSAENFVFYNDRCFSCDMIFNVCLVQHTFTKEFTGDLRWYFVYRDGKWLAANMTLNK